MSTRVNPPPQLKLPKKFAIDTEVRSFFEQQQRILYQLWRRTGGSEDAVERQGQSLISTNSRASVNTAKINSLELKKFNVINTEEDLTTKRNQIIICKNVTPITITLDPQAIKEDEIHIKRRGAEVTVIGLIDGLNDIIINVPNYSAHLVFNGQDWSQI